MMTIVSSMMGLLAARGTDDNLPFHAQCTVIKDDTIGAKPFILRLKIVDNIIGQPQPAMVNIFEHLPDSSYRFLDYGFTLDGRAEIIFKGGKPASGHYHIKIEGGTPYSYLYYGIRRTAVKPDDTFVPFKSPIIIPAETGDTLVLPPIAVGHIDARLLGEVEITATKLKFYHKGDTLVYNADAFMLSNGSMLEELVSQLPGVELKDGGQIYSNGRMVESLLINGKDLFNGKTDLALTNLGAYTVDNIKIYDKMGRLSSMVGMDTGDKKLVMDVKLKREYCRGWLGNLQGGYGSDSRYMGRMFNMVFTPSTSFTAYLNTNNLSDSRTPGRDDGLWATSQMNTGHERNIKGGATYYSEGNDNTWTVKGEVNARRTKTGNSSYQVKEYFEPSVTFGYGNENNQRKSYGLDSYHNAFVQLGDRLNVSLTGRIDWSHSSGRYDCVSALLSDELEDLTPAHIVGMLTSSALNDSVLNCYVNESSGRQHRLFGGAYLEANYFLSRGDVPRVLKLNASVTHNRYDDETFSRYLSRSRAEDTDTMYRNLNLNKPNSSTEVKGTLTLLQFLGWKSLQLPLTYSFTHTESHNAQRTFGLPFGSILDLLTGNGLAMLPDRTEIIPIAGMTQESRQGSTSHHLGIGPKHRIPFYAGPYDIFINPYAGIDYSTQWLKQYIAGETWMPSHDKLTFSTGININWNVTSWRYRSQFSYFTSSFDIGQLSRKVFDNTLITPAAVSGLRDAYRMHMRISGENMGKRISQNFHVDASYNGNPVVSHTRPDPETGGYTYTVLNDRYSLWADGEYLVNYSFGPHKVWMIRARHSVVANRYGRREGNTTGYVNSGLSADIRWHNDCLNLGATVRAGRSWHELESASFSSQAYTAMGDVLAKLPMGWEINTDCRFLVRHGYVTREANRSRWIWNATVSKSLCLGSLIVAIEGYDLLNQRDSFSASSYEWGRVLTQTGLISRYVLLHAIYRFNVNPKNTKEPGKAIDPTTLLD